MWAGRFAEREPFFDTPQQRKIDVDAITHRARRSSSRASRRLRVVKHVSITRSSFTAEVMATDFLLNCFVLGDKKDNVFTVKIPKTDNVSILKDEIKNKKAPHLNHVAASDLELWEVSFPIDDHAYKKSPTDPPLRPNKRLFSLWHGNPSDDDLHILIKAPGMLQAFLFQLL
jgi:hypothetical protein